MFKKSDISGVLSVGLKLFLITAISALILAVVNNFTSPIIAENTAKKQASAMEKVLPAAKKFNEVDINLIDLSQIEVDILSVHRGYVDNGEQAGYVVMASPKGYGGNVDIAVGVDNNSVVTGVNVISHSETPGLGAKCTSESFINQFVDKSANIELVKNSAAGNQIDAITSATITSKAVTGGVNSAIMAVNLIKEAE